MALSLFMAFVVAQCDELSKKESQKKAQSIKIIFFRLIKYYITRYIISLAIKRKILLILYQMMVIVAFDFIL